MGKCIIKMLEIRIFGASDSVGKSCIMISDKDRRIILDAGMLILKKNLCFGKRSWFGLLGNITGNENVLELSSSITAISSLSDEIIDCAVFLVDEKTTLSD